MPLPDPLSLQITLSCSLRYHCHASNKTAQIGGSARGYQAIFVPSTALASPGYDGQPAVYLYIAGLEMNVLNCRRQGHPDCRGAGLNDSGAGRG
jgi:hypothetical protein